MRVGFRVAAVAAGTAALVLAASGLTATSGAWAQAAPETASAASVDMEHAKATFEGLCVNCHDIGLITAQGHDRAGWEEVITRMYGFGLAGSDEEVNEVLEYLVANYPAQQ